ncbi:hypothetical protein ID866_3802 [Astraeus odoratus]|nr:hypothetical protein ID866_3802 [Astraeus odoratus]
MTAEHDGSSHSLPAIPTLPPIEIPGGYDDQVSASESGFYQPAGIHLPPVTSTPQDPTSSTASSPVLMRNPSLATRSSPVDTSLQLNHWTSASVDSLLIHQTGNSSRASSPAGVGSNASSTTDSSRNRRTESSVELRRREPETVPPYARSRGHSVSTMSDSHDSIIEQDFESDSWQPLRRTSDKCRRSSVKGNEQARPSRRPGDLKLPSRNPPVQFAQFAHPPPREDNSRRLHSTISLQSFPTRHSSLADVMSSRVRSGSLGLQADTGSYGSRSLLIDTVHPTLYPREVTIAVVGTPGCGKSTFVAEDAKANGVSDLAPLFSSSRSTPFRYTRNLDRLKRESPCHSVIVHEFDITTLTTPPQVEGMFICYDCSDASSFAPIADFLRLIHPMKYSVIALALKTDKEAAVDPKVSVKLFDQYDIGMVPVDNSGETGRMRMRKAFNFLLKSLLRTPNLDFRNPASPEAAGSPIPWENRRSASVVRTPPAPVYSVSPDHTTSFRLSPTTTLPTPPPMANSPTRARSTSDLHSEHEKARSGDPEDRKLSNARSINNLASTASLQSSSALLLQPPADQTNGHEDEERQPSKEKEPRPIQYATLEELLDKLLFLAVSGDDPTFISHFLLTYRRFASPRSILLAMQKRMRQLDNSLGDPMFASYAQMSYPQDFAVPGASGALNALVKSITCKTYLLHYGSDFLPFLAHISTLVDSDATWALKTEPLLDDIEDPYSVSDSEDETLVAVTAISASTSMPSIVPSQESSITSGLRERKQSLPLSAKALIMPISTHGVDVPEISPKQLLKELLKHSQELQNYDCSEIAQEITRVEAKMFLAIEVIIHFLLPAKTENWVVSLILCHDKPKNRAKQIEKFVDIAQKLRALNNYSALRAFVAGINNSTFQGDDTMEAFKLRAPDHYKSLLSWDVLLQHRGAHQAYRMALKNTKGACIPAL